MTTTPNMGLVLPDDHGSFDLWGGLLNAIFANRIDLHDHTPGLGTPVKSAGLRIDADVPWAFGGTPFAITGAKAFDFSPVASATMTGYAGALFLNSSDNELYYRTVGGSNVKVTNGAALNVAAFVGGIGGDYSAVGALLSYDDATDSYWFQQEGAPRPWARVRTGDVDIYQTAASIVNRVRLRSPNALAASYELVLPTALPGTTQLLQVTAAGVLAGSGVVANGAGDLTLTGAGIINLDGTADLKHAAAWPMPLHPAEFVQAAGAAGTYGAVVSGGSGITYCARQITSAVANGEIQASVPGLRVGDRITTVQVFTFANANVAGNVNVACNVATQQMSPGAALVIRGTNNVNHPSPADQSFVVTVNYTILAGEMVFLGIQATGAGQSNGYLRGIVVNVTRP